MLAGVFDAMKNCVRCNGALATMPGEVNVVRFIAFLIPFDLALNAPFVKEKSVKSPEIPPQSSGVGASRCVQCDEELSSF